MVYAVDLSLMVSPERTVVKADTSSAEVSGASTLPSVAASVASSASMVKRTMRHEAAVVVDGLGKALAS